MVQLYENKKKLIDNLWRFKAIQELIKLKVFIYFHLLRIIQSKKVKVRHELTLKKVSEIKIIYQINCSMIQKIYLQLPNRENLYSTTRKLAE